jgi:hydrogenase maturation protein HypF
MVQTSYKIVVTGVVQGVGFRPFVYQLATSSSLNGYVINSTKGVQIVINLQKNQLGKFLSNLRELAPPISQIDTISYKEIKSERFSEFSIRKSEDKEIKSTLIPPDLSICKECESELFDPKNRRYLHPFITCTNCGVRYSIIKTLPYDRINTSMSDFKMCKECEEEYSDPNSRRYHAQPIGCHNCGPKLSLSIEQIADEIKDGKIVAIKGVGGYHLVCDGTNKKAIERLRQRKNRPLKPLAVMVKDMKMANELAYINDLESSYLNSLNRPIVVLRSKRKLSNSIAVHISKIGLFLPYTPLHLLLLHKLNRPIVATSANISGEPICSDINSLKKLKGVYDLILDHDREIVNSSDDSVLMVVKDQSIMLRRSRGYAPSSIKLPYKLKDRVLALGANQKSCIAIGFDNEVILSPYIGDLGSIESLEYFKKNIHTLDTIYDFKPDYVVCDKHPEYISTKYAKQNYKNITKVQHHYAHILAVMAEKKIDSMVLGVAFDGTGFGDDGTLWGGEFLKCDLIGYKRVAHIKNFKLLGADKAIKEPRRVALSLMFDIFGKKAMKLKNPTTNAFTKKELSALYMMWQKGLNAPLSSSMGRIFDSVASIVGLTQIISYEGESGMKLEEFYDVRIDERYDFLLEDDEINLLPMIEAIINESQINVAVSKFFNTIVYLIKEMSSKYKLPVVLSGGVFQNRVLLELILKELPEAIIPNDIPPNDSGVALGQIMAVL